MLLSKLFYVRNEVIDLKNLFMYIYLFLMYELKVLLFEFKYYNNHILSAFP